MSWRYFTLGFTVSGALVILGVRLGGKLLVRELTR